MMEIPKRIESEPALRWKLVVNLEGKSEDSREAREASLAVSCSEIVRTLLSERNEAGKIPRHPYSKWTGAHWVLSLLADLGYPKGDETLKPLMRQVYDWLLGDSHTRRIKAIQGRTRRCASQEGNALWYSLKLGLADERSLELARRLISWQWPDGGWNCDKRPEAVNSSYHESLIPLRALILYERITGDPEARRAKEHAQELFLKRRLFQRQKDGQVMDERFLLMHYPPFWHYDILSALKVFGEAGRLDDPRLRPALDILEEKRLPDGGFPAEEYFFHQRQPTLSGYSTVNWGKSGQRGGKVRTSNVFVTADALFVLKRAGREKSSLEMSPNQARKK